jgi:predicted transcriptional regulator of viral defense system
MTASRGHFTSEQAAEFWGSKAKARKKVHELEKRGWVERLERGKYVVVPLDAGIERAWSEDPYLVASSLVQPAAIGYWSAIQYWNWTEQIPRVVYIQTTTRKSVNERSVLGVLYKFVTVSNRKFYGHVKEWHKGKAILISDKEKTLIDCADDVERAGTIEELAKAVKSSVDEISWKKLDEYVDRFPNGAVRKRLGFLFERLGKPLPQEAQQILKRWASSLSAGVVPLQPGGGVKGGRISTHWRVRANVEFE